MSELTWNGSPCGECLPTPCCRFLPITQVDPETTDDLLALEELLRLRYIELGLREDGRWTVFYCRPCRNLIEELGACGVHGSAEQPAVCRRYDATRCWYRTAFSSSENPELIRFDHGRMRRLHDQTIFDEVGVVYRTPEWSAMIEQFSTRALSLPVRQGDTHRNAAATQAGAQVCATQGAATQGAATQGAATQGAATQAFVRTAAPAGAVDGLRLRVPPGRPSKPADWDLVRFRTAFPGVAFADDDAEAAFLLDTEIAVDAPRLPLRLPKGMRIVPVGLPEDPDGGVKLRKGA